MFASVVVADGLAELKAAEQQLKEKKRLLMWVEARNKWEQATKAQNPQYVVGSRRKATEEDLEKLSHCHGEVADIICADCGTVRTVNLQDAKQCKLCAGCQKKAIGERAKTRRAQKRLAGKSVDQIREEIASLEAQIAGLE